MIEMNSPCVGKCSLDWKTKEGFNNVCTFYKEKKINKFVSLRTYSYSVWKTRIVIAHYLTLFGHKSNIVMIQNNNKTDLNKEA